MLSSGGFYASYRPTYLGDEAMTNGSEVTEGAHTSIEDLPERLQEVYAKINECLVEEESNKIRARYEIGRQVHNVVRAPGTYGENAVKKLAEALNISESVLYRFCDVAEQWTPSQFERLAARRDEVRGRPISWSALTEIAEVADAGKRRDLLEAVFGEGLSVRQLRQRKGELLGHEVEASSPIQRSIAMGLGEVLELSRVLLDRQDTWNKSVFAPIEGVGPEDNPAAILQRIEQTETAQRELRDFCDVVLERLEVGRQRINTLLQDSRRTRT